MSASMAWGARNLISTQVPTCLWVTAAALSWSIYFRLGGAKGERLGMIGTMY